MEQRFYKVRLTSGRVIGPVDLDRLKSLILKEQITGLEMARLYPTGDWKDINTYPEVAELLMLKLEGKLVVEPPKEAVVELAPVPEPGSSESGIPLATEAPVPPPATPTAEVAEVTQPNQDATAVLTSNEERTVLYTPEDESLAQERREMGGVAIVDPISGAPPDGVEPAAPKPPLIQIAVQDESRPDPAVASEKTVMLDGRKARPPRRKKVFLAVALAVGAFLVLSPEPEKKPAEVERPFRVEMPMTLPADPQKSEKTYQQGLGPYLEDTVEGYKKAARLFLTAAGLDSNNVRALCMLASSYLSLIDVVTRDEGYFNVVTRIIELERAKGMDLAETVIADVELYNVLGNPDVAISRIVDFSKTHPQFGSEMYYYLAQSFFLKGQSSESLKYLNNIDPKSYFSPRINFLYGEIYEKNGQVDEAIKAYLDVVARSPRHVKARTRLSELYFRKDNLPEAGKHADYVIHNRALASRAELGKAHYMRARMREVAAQDMEALHDLEIALKNMPDEPDVLLDLYTLRARVGAKVKEAQGKARMFHYMALGEKALIDGNLHEAMVNFISARDAQDDEAVPLLRIADIFRRKGDMQSARSNLAKAVKLASSQIKVHAKYISTLIDAYEFAEASAALKTFKDLNPPVALFEKLQGDLYFKQERLREAHAYYKRALGLSNVDSSIYVSFANALFKGNDFKGSAFYYGLAQRFDPFNVDATIGIGKSLSEIESLEKGVEYVQGALHQSPHKAALLNGLAEIYQRKGDYPAALKFAENALTADPGFALAHKTRGDAYASQDKTKEALDAYLTYTNLAPLDPQGHIERYRLFLKKPDLLAAKTEIEKVIKDYPKYPGVYYMLGEAYREGQNFESAFRAAQEEIKNNPSYVPAYVLEGTALNLAHEYGKAVVELGKGLKIASDNVPALIQAGIANHNLKTYAAAQSMLERALALDSGNPEVHKRLGILYHDLSNAEKSKQHFRAYLDLYPNAPDREDVERMLAN